MLKLLGPAAAGNAGACTLNGPPRSFERPVPVAVCRNLPAYSRPIARESLPSRNPAKRECLDSGRASTRYTQSRRRIRVESSSSFSFFSGKRPRCVPLLGQVHEGARLYHVRLPVNSLDRRALSCRPTHEKVSSRTLCRPAGARAFDSTALRAVAGTLRAALCWHRACSSQSSSSHRSVP